MSHFKLSFDRALSRGTQWQLLIIGCIIVISLALSYILLSFTGDWQAFCDEHRINKFMLPLYLLIDQNLYNDVYTSEYGKMLGITSGITFLIGIIFFNGAIIAILSDFIKRRVENYQNGETHYLKSGHYVIMGYDEIVSSMILHIFSEEPDAYILLLTSAPAQFIQEKLRESVPRKYQNHIIVNYGHRISADYFKDIHLESAKQIFIAGDRRKPQHDAVNVECVQSICAYLRDKKHTVNRITCLFEDLDTYASFRTTDVFMDALKDLHIDFIPYNFYVSWARRVFVERTYISKGDQKLQPYPYLCKQGIGVKDDHFVHLVFVGMSNLAVTFANEAANILHFPNGKHTRITFIDIKADKEMPVFITRNHNFFDIQPYTYRNLMNEEEPPQTYRRRFEKEHPDGFLDIDFEFIKGDIFAQNVQDLICQWAKDEQQYLSVFLAMANQRDNFAVAMNMPDAIYNCNIPIFVRQDSSDNFITLLREADKKAPRDEKAKPEYRSFENGQIVAIEAHGRYAHIYPFGMNGTSFFADEKAFSRAKLINYLYKTADYSTNTFQPLEQLAKKGLDKIREEADGYWKELTVADKWSNLYFAYGLEYKLLSLRAMRSLDITDDNHDFDPLKPEEQDAISRVEHNRWNVEKLLMGYRKPLEREDLYGKEKAVQKELKNNKFLFIHAQIRPFDDLAPDMRQLDIEFAKYIPWIMNSAK